MLFTGIPTIWESSKVQVDYGINILIINPNNTGHKLACGFKHAFYVPCLWDSWLIKEYVWDGGTGHQPVRYQFY